MNYNYDTTTLLSTKENYITDHDGYLIGTLFLAPQKNIINAPYYGIEFDPNSYHSATYDVSKTYEILKLMKIII